MDSKRALRQLREIKKRTPKGAYNGEMRLAAEAWDSDWKILISTIMSAQTRDETTIPVAENLFKKYSGLKKLSRASVEDVERLIKRINYHKTKAKNIVNCAKMIVEVYGGRVPRSVEELVKLPGVGRKTANVFLSEEGGDNIGVDTHVFYISKKLGWVRSNTRDKVEKDLEELFPKNVWGKINPTLVRFGKSYTSRKRKDEILEEINRIK